MESAPELELPPEIEQDLTRLEIDGREIILVGTAHISQASVDAVERVIDHESPDAVCVELDRKRFESLRSDTQWEDLDLIEIIKDGKLTFLLARLALTAFQKRMGANTGVTPGAEMAAAADAAEAMGVPVELVDRDVQITLLRAWRLTPWWRRAEVALMLFASLFQGGDISEDDLSELRESGTIDSILEELGDVFPEVKGVLVDERDLFMAHHIRAVEGDKIVAILGAAHKSGVAEWLQRPTTSAQIDEVTHVPERSWFSRIFPWLIPLIVLGVFGYFGATAEWKSLETAAVAWVLANGVLSALGAIAAYGHPLTVASAFLASPITSLNPSIGAGYVTAFVQTFVASPKVRDLHSIGDDLVDWKGWWRNRLSRVLLVFVFSSIGSSLGPPVALGWIWLKGIL